MARHCQAGALALDAPELVAAHAARVVRLGKDLAFLDRVAPPVAGEAVRDKAFAVGCLYTVLGSTLGGKVISRQLEKLLPDGRGRSFFTGGQDDAAHWRLFCTRLEETDYSAAGVEAGARHAFDGFAALIQDWQSRQHDQARTFQACR
jgi:heme oxygenase